MPAALAAFAVFIFISILSGYLALVGWLQTRYFGGDKHWFSIIFGLPALWVFFEWVRSWLFTGFPWLNLGYSQVPSFMSGLAPVVGVYGISFFVAISASLVSLIWLQPVKRKIWLSSLLALWVGIVLIGKINWVSEIDKPVQVAMIQGNVSIAKKWDRKYRSKITADYLWLSKLHGDVDLIIWPEAAIPGYLDVAEQGVLQKVRAHAKETSTDYIIGVLERVQNQGQQKFYNSAIAIDSEGKDEGVYRKRHLVPFGEFMPLKPVLGWLLNYLKIPMSDLSSGTDRNNILRAAGHLIGISICYEDAFGEEVIQAVPTATMLVNISEDAWFGDSFAPFQRLQIAQMRAMEAGRPMVRAANTGPSAVIDHNGRITARSEAFIQTVLVATVQPMQGVTPYGRFGNGPVIMFTILLIIAGWQRTRELAGYFK